MTIYLWKVNIDQYIGHAPVLKSEKWCRQTIVDLVL